jgi:tight adherence protein B
MLAAILVFVLAAGSIVGAYAAYLYLPAELERRRFERRLKDVSLTQPAPSAGDEASLVMRPAESPLPVLDKILAGTSAGPSLAKLIEQAGYQITPGALVGIIVGLAIVSGLLTRLFFHQVFAPAVAAAIGVAAPIVFLMNRRTARLRTFEEQFPEALDLLSRALKAGHAFQTALGMVADEMKPPVGPEFRKTFDQQNYGLPLRDALHQMTENVPILDVRFFVTAVLIQKETGGNLSEILENLARVIRERFKIRRQIRIHTAHGRFTGFVLLALPAGLAILLSIINPEHMDLLFKERLGQMMLMIAIVMQVIGFFWIRKVIKIEV